MLNIFAKEEVNYLVNKKDEETKLGENILLINSDLDFFEEIENTKASFVIIGVPEDIGVKINGKKGGVHTAFFPAIKEFLNTQENQFLTGKDILLLGYLDYLDTVKTFVADDPEKSDYLVKQIDKDLSELIHFLISVGKIPIIIGGGQNNAYGSIKGLATASKTSVNAINFSAYTNLQKTGTRHSGNAFTYAINEGYLNKYFMFGLHENYTPQYTFDYINEHITIEYTMFEEIAIYQTTTFKRELNRALTFISHNRFGIEINLDSLKYFPNNAMSPSGFTTEDAREFIYFFGKSKNSNYLHISEANPSIEKNEITQLQVSKFISYLITDFIKAKITPNKTAINSLKNNNE